MTAQAEAATAAAAVRDALDLEGAPVADVGHDEAGNVLLRIDRNDLTAFTDWVRVRTNTLRGVKWLP